MAVSRIAAWVSDNAPSKPANNQTESTVASQSGSNRIMVVAIANEDTGAPNEPSGVTWGGQSLTGLGTASITVGTTTTMHVSLWYLLEAGIAAASGTTLHADWTFSPAQPAGSPAHAAAFYSGVNQTTPIIDSDEASSTASGTLSLTLTSETDGYLIAAIAAGNAVTYAWTNATEQLDIQMNATATLSVADEATTGSSIAPSATMTGTLNRHAIAAITIAAASGTTNLSLAATAVGVPRVVREVRLTEMASDVGVPRVVREVRLTERAGAVGTAAMSLLRVIIVTLAATAVGTARMTKQAQLVLAATARGTGAVVKKALLNLAGQARGVPAVTRSVAMNLRAAAVGAVTVALLEISTILAAVTAAGVAAMSMIVHKVMASSAVVTPALSTSATVAERVVGRLTGQAGLGLYLKAKAGWRRRRSNWKPRSR